MLACASCNHDSRPSVVANDTKSRLEDSGAVWYTAPCLPRAVQHASNGLILRLIPLLAAGVTLQHELPVFSEAVRSLAFRPASCIEELWLACGLESGHIHLVALDTGQSQHSLVWATDRFTMHAAAVRRLCWAPGEGLRQGDVVGRLASCGEDHAIKFFRTFEGV